MTEQTIFVAGMKVSLNGQTKDVQNADHLALLVDAGWQPVAQVVAPRANRNEAPPKKRHISDQEAKNITDKNLAESLGIPSELVAKGENFTFKAKKLGNIAQISRRTGNEFATCQLEYNGNKFCVLATGKTTGDEMTCRLDATDATRSGLTVTVID